jgi:hypothetical protein
VINSELLSVLPPRSNSEPTAIVSAITEEADGRARRIGRRKII